MSDNSYSQEIADLLCRGRVLIAGAGVAGRGVARMLIGVNPRLIIADDNKESGQELVDELISNGSHHYSPGDSAPEWCPVNQARDKVMAGEADIIVTSPGWNPQSPLFYGATIPIIGDIDAAWVIDQAEIYGSAHQWVAITGTNGKTTTTAMTTAIVKAAGRKALSVGNIGQSPGELIAQGGEQYEIFIAEVSSFQLHWAPHFLPHSATVLNIAEDHLDWHGSFSAYAEDKMRVLAAPHPVIALDEPNIVEQFFGSHSLQNPDTLYGFTVRDPQEVWSVLEQRYPRLSEYHWGAIVGIQTRDGDNSETGDPEKTQTPQKNLVAYYPQQVADVDIVGEADHISPAGVAGQYDAAAAAALALSLEIPSSVMPSALASFRVAAHRGDIVHRDENIWVDNSKATNPHAARIALQGYENIVWIAGGQLKGADITEILGDIAEHLRAVICLGVDRRAVRRAVQTVRPDIPAVLIDSSDPRQAMAEVVRVARGLAQKGDPIILAPAAASLDMFSGMAQRGDLFAFYARSLEEEKDE